jgi:hypothetical protein
MEPVQVWGAWGVVGGWSVLVALPFLVLRAIQVVLQVVRPEPVTSDFRLFTMMQREAQWESLTGLAVLSVLFAGHGQANGAAFAVAAVLATIVAMGPVSGFARALVLMPVLLGLRAMTNRTEQDDRELFGEATPDGGLPPLMALYNSPPWYLRASWLANLAWVPMVGLLMAQLLIV